MKFEQNPQKNELIGAGAYKRAYKIEAMGEIPEVHLVMKSEYTNEQMKGLFYLNKIATALFPGRVASVNQSGNFKGDETTSSQFLADYHEPDAQHKEMQQHMKALDGKYWSDTDEEEETVEAFSDIFDIRGEEMEKNKEVQDFRDAYDAAGFHNPESIIGITWGPQDIIFKPDGSFVYVDIDIPWDEPQEVEEGTHTIKCLRFDPEKLKQTIAAMPEEKRVSTQAYYDRLMELCREAGFEV